jgi:hypothetical protein
MPFNTITGSEAGKISKRGKELPIEITTGLQELAMSILTDLKLNEDKIARYSASPLSAKRCYTFK